MDYLEKLQQLQKQLDEINSDIELTKKQKEKTEMFHADNYNVAQTFALRPYILQQQLDDLNFRKLDIERQISDLRECE